MRTIVRIFFKLLLGFTASVALISVILMFVIHLPDSQRIEEFKEQRAAFEEVNTTLRQILEDRGRSWMVFYADFDANTLTDTTNGGGVVYSGEAVDRLKKFDNNLFDTIRVEEDRTIFYYGRGLEAVVYMKNGRNPGTFTERFVEFVTRSYKVADKWYYTMFCDLSD